jgi:hypothetical protein
VEPVPPINRRERGLRGVEPVPRLRLLTPAERQEARRERERLRDARSARESAQDPQGRADHQA